MLDKSEIVSMAGRTPPSPCTLGCASPKRGLIDVLYIVQSYKDLSLLSLQVPGKAVVREPLTAFISFTNPLPVPLKGGVFTLEGAGLLSATQIHVK